MEDDDLHTAPAQMSAPAKWNRQERNALNKLTALSSAGPEDLSDFMKTLRKGLVNTPVNPNPVIDGLGYRTVLQHFILFDRIHLLHYLLEDATADPTVVTSEHGNALHLAADNSNIKAVQAVLKWSTRHGRQMINSVATIKDYKHTPLTLALRYDGTPEMVKLLIDNNAEVNWQCEHNFTPLLWCLDGICFAKPRKVECFELLLNSKADPNLGEVDEMSPLQYCLDHMTTKIQTDTAKATTLMLDHKAKLQLTGSSLHEVVQQYHTVWGGVASGTLQSATRHAVARAFGVDERVIFGPFGSEGDGADADENGDNLEEQGQHEGIFSTGDIVSCPGCEDRVKAPTQARALRCASCQYVIHPETHVNIVENEKELAAKKAKAPKKVPPKTKNVQPVALQAAAAQQHVAAQQQVATAQQQVATAQQQEADQAIDERD
eukprot:COSAG02_NODE_3308_length_6959_cov_3.565015_5_plen_434_part_00